MDRMQNTAKSPANATSEESKAISLLQYIKGYHNIKQPPLINVSKYIWHKAFSELPADNENIIVNYPDSLPEESAAEADCLLSVRKPEFEECPPPDEILVEWIENNWRSFLVEEIKWREEIVRTPDLAESQSAASSPSANLFAEKFVAEKEHFSDNIHRVVSWRLWLAKREAWRQKQLLLNQTAQLFSDLYGFRSSLENSSEPLEILAANGTFLDKDDSQVNHPLILKRASIIFDAEKNIIKVVDTEALPELYKTVITASIGSGRGNILNDYEAELKTQYLHPLNRIETPLFLRRLAHSVSSAAEYSDDDEPVGWKEQNRILIYQNPMLIIRSRTSDIAGAIDGIIDDIQHGSGLSPIMQDLVKNGSSETIEPREKSFEDKLAEAGGESTAILLAKEANREQLEIAERIEQYNAVLVQGPPGTGKTHTIANLTGHFLAQGKSVLITSHTRKALRVLKEHLPREMRALSVSMLDDSTRDMQSSVNEILAMLASANKQKLDSEIDALEKQRVHIIAKLADLRRKMMTQIKWECNSLPINGEEISPAKAADFVRENEAALSYIPGEYIPQTPCQYLPFPLDNEEISFLYASNGLIDAAEEAELAHTLIAPDEIISPQNVASLAATQRQKTEAINKIAAEMDWHIQINADKKVVSFQTEFGEFALNSEMAARIGGLAQTASLDCAWEKWQIAVAAAGKRGGVYAEAWRELCATIQATSKQAAETWKTCAGNSVSFAGSMTYAEKTDLLERLKEHFASPHNFFDKLLGIFNRDNIEADKNAVTVNGNPLSTAADCDTALQVLQLEQELLAQRAKCAAQWDKLMAACGASEFTALDETAPEDVAQNYIAEIDVFLRWHEQEFMSLNDILATAGLPVSRIFALDRTDTAQKAIEKYSGRLKRIIPPLLNICRLAEGIYGSNDALQPSMAALRGAKENGSRLAAKLLAALQGIDDAEYAAAYNRNKEVYDKREIASRREALLARLGRDDCDWAQAIRLRVGVHGQTEAPADIKAAWQWKQFDGIIRDLLRQSYDELQAESREQSRQYRQTTEEYAAKLAWRHLFRAITPELENELAAWRQAIKQLGKGTGKNAPKLRAEARQHMEKCQRAVPVWIMPVNKVIENFNLAKNKFDVVIFDEASQSDVTALPIVYMANKLIIVGDDEQVSPTAVGIQIDDIDRLRMTYLQNIVPNADRYTEQTSLYDIAMLKYKKRMLEEHFRCVPEIIGFSNMLSYDYRIKPLRDAGSSQLLPAVVNYRVAGGERQGNSKINENEARTIAALLKACSEQPEYAYKTYGVIVLKGNEQANLIGQLLKKFGLEERFLERHRVMCGEAPDFQGDERDVIFISLVDSSQTGGALPLMSADGNNALMKKRYNVAASRARDQLWVVHSLDADNDLKAGDLRKTLLDYARDPQAVAYRIEQAKDKAQSPFEEAVALALINKGYHIVQQKQVGAYFIDIVAICGKKQVAIECDGTRYHSTDEQVQADMERQIILERLGWRFIRIRGSEYYRYPAETMQKVFQRLSEMGIEPEASISPTEDGRSTELLERVKRRADEILKEEMLKEPEADEVAEEESALLIADIPLDVPPISKNIRPPKKRKGKTAEATKARPASSATANVKKKPKQPVPAAPETKTADNMASADELIKYIAENNIEYVDKRKTDGSLWIIGGEKELANFVAECQRLYGVAFKFTAGGGKASKHRDAWWLNNK